MENPVPKSDPQKGSQLTVGQIRDEFVSQQVKRWKAKLERLPRSELPAMVGPMCYSWEGRRGGQLGCTLPDREGGHVFIPYNDDKKGLPADLLQRTWKLESWATNPLSRPFMLQVNKLLQDEVREKCLPYLKDADPSRLNFVGRVNDVFPFLKMITIQDTKTHGGLITHA